ncbi:beta-phosphoglucomutase [Lentisphaerota bacterium ZTH]|nr:beta-phosphoglucomutase [Lentisphaerota bacterium]WET07236.1 beta-phosphoglucomutase [Lentisphaerota bacterium ZTH]
MSKVKAFIFDLDGVITDTAEFHYLAWKKLAQEEGMEFDREINETLKGVSRTESLKRILAHNGRTVSENVLEAWARRKNGYYLEFIETITPAHLLPRVVNILELLKQKGIKTALGSASKNARAVLSGLEITDYFDVIGDGNSVERSKPAPDLFLFCAEKLNVNPECCVVVEDAEAGVEAAKKAAMTVVGIGDPEKLSEADYVYGAPAEINLDLIL